MEGVFSLQKKIATGFLIALIFFILSAQIAQIINFVYIVPYSLVYLLFLSSSQAETTPLSLKYSIPYVFGLISDIILKNHIFFLSIAFVIASIIISYLINFLKISKTGIFFTLNIIYSMGIFYLNTPLWVCVFVFAVNTVSFYLFSYLSIKLLTPKSDEQT